jgi:hypothetical protein
MIEYFAAYQLKKDEMRFVMGGTSATANCGGGQSVTCEGETACSSTDGVGCSCTGGQKKSCDVM